MVELCVLGISLGFILKLIDGSPFVVIYKVDKETFDKVKKDKKRINWKLIERK